MSELDHLISEVKETLAKGLTATNQECEVLWDNLRELVNDHELLTNNWAAAEGIFDSKLAAFRLGLALGEYRPCPEAKAFSGTGALAPPPPPLPAVEERPDQLHAEDWQKPLQGQ